MPTALVLSVEQVCMNGRNMFMGYLDAEPKTRETFDDEGWVHSGDIGRRDDRGFLYITGRIKGNHVNWWLIGDFFNALLLSESVW